MLKKVGIASDGWEEDSSSSMGEEGRKSVHVNEPSWVFVSYGESEGNVRKRGEELTMLGIAMNILSRPGQM